MRAIIAAAGTGGHINPGIAIANKIKEEEPESSIMFIGTTRGLETDLVPRAGYELKTIESYGISRSITLKNIKRLIKTIESIGEAKKIIKQFKPDIIIGTGGYICISVCKAAQKLKIPYVIHESNVLPGVATKLLANRASKILLGFDDAKERLPRGTNIIVTGTPTKIENLELNENEVKTKKQQEGFNSDEPLILVFGGSQGAQSINSSMIEIIEKRVKTRKKEANNELKENNNLKQKDIQNKNYQIIWAVGQTQYNSVKEKLEKNKIDVDNIDGIKVLPYIYNMQEMMNICDLVVCRSGAMTITEIEKIGKPAIFIPYPYAAENHQEYNARALENKGAAEVILDKELNSNKLSEVIEKIILNPNKLKEMGENSKKLSIQNVENRIYVEVKETIHSNLKK